MYKLEKTENQMSNVVLKSKCGTKKPKPMSNYLNGSELYKKCKTNFGWNKDMALFNAYKHEFTNYNSVTMNDIYHSDLDYDESVKAMASVYRELLSLVPKKYEDVCKQQFLRAVKNVKRQVEKYEMLAA